jgi:hypothetical protein
MNDVSEMDEETFASQLTVKVISDKHPTTDALFDACLSAGLSYYDVEYGILSKKSKYYEDNNVISCGVTFPTFYNFRGGYYKNVMPTNKDTIDKILLNNSNLADKKFNTISMSFDNYLILVDFLDSLNAKPTYSVSSKYYEKYASQFELNDILEEKIITPDNLPTDAEEEIKKMIHQLIQLL